VVFQNNLLMGAAGQSDAAYTIDQSCRFDSDTPAYLSRTFGTPTSDKIWTFSFWAKLCKTDSGGYSIFMGAGDFNGNYTGLSMAGAIPDIKWEDYQSSAWKTQLRSNATYKDPSAWYHIVYSYDSTPSTPSASSIKIFVNGSQVTSFSSADYPSQNQASIINTAVANWIGGMPTNGSNIYFDGYMAEAVFVDGTALDADSFGETNSTTGQWVPKEISGLTFGNNGFHLDFADSTFLGKDARTSGDQVNSYASSQWGGATGSYTFSDGRLQADTDNKAIKSDDTFAGDFELQWEYKDKANWVIGVYETGEDGTFDDSNSIGGMASMTDSWYIQASSVAANNDIKYGGTTVDESVTIANGDVWNISRSSGTLKIERNGSTVHTWSQTSTNTVRIVFAQGDANADAISINWVDNSTLGNNFFSSGLAAADQMTDSPTDNLCLWNAVSQGTSTGGSNYSTLSNGNLVATASGSDYNWSFGTIKPSSGKWYWEITLTTDNGSNWVGVAQDLLKSSAAGDDSGFGSVNGFGYRDSNGYKINDSGTASSYGATYTAGDVIGVAMDLDNGKIWFSKDGTYQDSGDPAAGSDAAFETLSESYAPCIQQSSASAVFTANFGQSSFSTAAPTGFSALSAANLDDPTIAEPSDYFSSVLYAGDGSDGYEVTGVGFEPDMFWLKNRAATEDHYVFDSVRGVGTGAGKHISPNTTGAEVSDATVKAITSDGFTVEATGAAINTGNHVVWSWLEDATSGFDIVSYTGNGSNRTISHSLGAVPGQMIIKNLDTEIDWAVYNEGSLWHGAANLGYLTLNTTAVSYDNDEYWNDTTPTSSVFTVGTHNSVNKDSSPMIAYLWAGVEGFSSFGKYEGNGSTDGPFILTGFKPRFIVCKSYSGAKGWNMFDSARSTYNVAGAQLQANLDEAEATLNAVDLLSNGFKLRTADNAVNRNGYGFIYMAWAESSFKYATAR